MAVPLAFDHQQAEDREDERGDLVGDATKARLRQLERLLLGSAHDVVSLALDANVGKLFLFHHDPEHDDEKLDQIVEAARTLVLESGKSMEVDAAREGTEVWLGAKVRPEKSAA